MRLVIQRVSKASVKVDGIITGEIGHGLLVLQGVESEDTAEDVAYLASKVVQMRIFNDENGKMNCSVIDIGGDIMVVSQFTLFADTRKGNRPSFIRAARPETAIPLYESFCTAVAERLGKPVAKGVFGGDMKVGLINDGPVTITIDSKHKE